MARKSKAGAGGKKGASAKGGGEGATTSAKTAVNKTKKTNNIFKVADTKSKKKPKEVQGKLKKIKEAVKSKQEKVDANLKELHKDLVVKKPNTASASTKTATPLKKNKRTQANPKNVSQKLSNLKV